MASPDPTTALRPLADALGADVPDAPLTLDDVRRYLEQQVRRLLDRHPERLMHVLYRVDVDERAVMRLMAESPPGQLARDLAELLLQRHLQKLETRRRYRDAGDV
ncbi:MAG: hypothetical protein GVY18_00350 [Bacteroidetes bacterium]|jgi:hypothetical protein|nr:hypothetical protein [Bacteroidota bacterium]